MRLAQVGIEGECRLLHACQRQLEQQEALVAKGKIQAEKQKLLAAKTADEADLALSSAKREAERIVKEANDEQLRLVSEQEVVKQAENHAEDIIEEARAREREIRLGAEDYADDILNTLEVNLEKFLAAVQRGRDRLAGRDHEQV